MPTYAVLLRAVNVGGHGPLPMSTLRQVLTGLGYQDVRTYLQSGNAVVRTPAPAAKVAAQVRGALATATGRDVDLVVRSAAQLRGVVDGWPFAADVAAPSARHVVFLGAATDATPLRGLAAEGFSPERFAVVGQEVYLWLPAGLGRSRLAAALTRRLRDTPATVRGWNTVTALADLAGG